MGFSTPARQKLTATLGTYVSNELESMIDGMGGPVVHLDNEEIILGRKTFAVSVGINGLNYEWPEENLKGVLANDGDGNLCWREMAGAGTVTEVGLIAPPEFVVGEPVRNAGNLRLDKANQQPHTIYCGPATGVGKPSFRKLVADDVPKLPIAKIAELVTTLGLKADVASVKLIADDLRESVGRRVELTGFNAAIVDFQKRLAELSKLKADQEATTRSEAKLASSIDKKADRSEMEAAIEEVLDRLDEAVTELKGKVSKEKPVLHGDATINNVVIVDGSNLTLGHNKGTKIGVSRNQKMGFFGSIPVAQPTGDVISGLANLGLIANPTLWQSDIVGLVERLEAIEQKLGAGHPAPGG